MVSQAGVGSERKGLPPGFVERMAVVNEVLSLFVSGTRVEWRPGRGMYVIWKQMRGGEVARRWQSIGGGGVPVWCGIWPRGGTCTEALFQLIRWAQAKPVLPLSTWRYWTSDTVGLGRERGPQIVRLLTAGGYPDRVPCVLCGQPVINGIDWWNLNGVSGPCCWGGGCRAEVDGINW